MLPFHDSLPVDRRCALGIGIAAVASTVPHGLAAGAGTIGSVSLAEGTNFAAAVSPDGQAIAIDLLGILWILPFGGGDARRLTDHYADLGRPCWSPDGTRIAFQSYRSGNFHIWTVRPDGSDLRQLTTGIYDHREPCFTSEGTSILFSSDRSGRYRIHRLDLASGAVEVLSRGEGQHSEPCVSPDGKSLAYVADGVRLMRAGMMGSAAETVSEVQKSPDRTRSAALYAPSFAPGGTLSHLTIVDGVARLHLGGDVLVSGEDIYPFQANWLVDGSLVYTAGGKIRQRGQNGGLTVIPFEAAVAVSEASYRRRVRNFTSQGQRPVVGIGAPMLSPDGMAIAFRALNDIYVLTVGDPRPKLLIGGPYYKCDPAWSPDGKHLAYSTDRGGTLDLWLRDLTTGQDRQLTHLPGAAVTSGSWSGDGKRLACLDQNGALHVIEVATGEVERVYDALWEPGRPSFSSNGQHIAYAAFKPVSARYREGLSEVLVVDRLSGKGAYTPIMPGKSIATRGDDGPVWSPDGRHLAYIFASTLWVQPVTPDGSFNGEPRQLTTEVSDAPSWSGDSATLLYLSAGKLRLISIEGGRSSKVPFRMTWAIARPPGRTLIAGARVWDGLVPRYREADVLIEGNSIREVVTRGSAISDEVHRVDGRGLTLMPGLVDMHTHCQMQGFGYGDRMGRVFLAMGVTATRSPGGPAYHMTEDREAIDAGRRVAPRHFSTGEAIDGSRIFYNFMRPVTEPGQLQLELERARALTYDLIKTYVRLDHRTQAEVIEAAHALGLPVSSHYHYPALRNGGDCVEHLGATSRFGYSRTVTALGAAYEDVAKLFAAARAGRTPTLFTAGALLVDYPELVSDERVKTLFPAWELAKLEQKASIMASGDRSALLASLERNVAQIKDMMALGWHVHAGTDAPIDNVAVSLHLNLRAMTRFGISPYETLLTTTRHAGAFLGVPLGTIAPRQLADLILVEGDPLARIEDVARVRATIAGGVTHERASLLAPFVGPHAAISPSHVHARDAVRSRYWEAAGYVETSRAACCAGHQVA